MSTTLCEAIDVSLQFEELFEVNIGTRRLGTFLSLLSDRVDQALQKAGDAQQATLSLRQTVGEQVDGLTRVDESHKRQLATNDEVLVALRKSNTDLKRELDEVREAGVLQATELEKSKRQVTTFESDLQTFRKSTEQLRTRVEDLLQESEATKRTTRQLQTREGELQESVSQLKRQVELLGRQQDEQNEAIGNVQRWVEQASRREVQQVEEMEEWKKRSEDLLKELLPISEQLPLDIQELRHHGSEITALVSQVEQSAERRLNDLQADVEAAHSMLDGLSRRDAELQEEVDEGKQAMEVVRGREDMFKADLESVGATATRLSQQLEGTKRAWEATQKRVAENAVGVAESHRQVAANTRHCQELQAAFQSIDGTVQEMKTNVTDNTRVLEDTQRDLQFVQRDVGEHHSELEQQKQNVTALQRSSTTQQHEVADLIRVVEGIQKHHSDYTRAIDELKRLLDVLKSSTAPIEDMLSVRAIAETLQSRMQDNTDRMASHEDLLERMQHQLEDKQDLDPLRRAVEQTHRKLNDQHSEIGQMRIQVDKVRAGLADSTKHIRADMDSMQNKFRTDVEHVQGRIPPMNGKVKRCNDEVEGVKRWVEKLDRKDSELTEQMESVQRQVDRARQLVGGFSSDIETLKSSSVANLYRVLDMDSEEVQTLVERAAATQDERTKATLAVIAPRCQWTAPELSLVFSSQRANGLFIDCDDPLAELRVVVGVQRGQLDFQSCRGVRVIGSSSSNVFEFLGMRDACNQALEGMTYTAPPDADGCLTLSIEVSRTREDGAWDRATSTVDLLFPGRGGLLINAPGFAAGLPESNIPFTGALGITLEEGGTFRGALCCALRVNRGRLRLQQSRGVTFGETGSDARLVEVTGTRECLNTALQTLTFRPPKGSTHAVFTMSLEVTAPGNRDLDVAMHHLQIFVNEAGVVLATHPQSEATLCVQYLHGLPMFAFLDKIWRRIGRLEARATTTKTSSVRSLPHDDLRIELQPMPNPPEHPQQQQQQQQQQQPPPRYPPSPTHSADSYRMRGSAYGYPQHHPPQWGMPM